MKAILIAVALTCVAVPALAQGTSMSKGAGGKPGMAAQTEPPAPKVDEGAYRASVDKVPDQKPPSDPWGTVRAPTQKSERSIKRER